MLKSYFLLSIRLIPLMQLILRNGISLKKEYIYRFIFLLLGSIGPSLFSKQEHLLYGKSIKNTPVPQNPIFIIGHWRTGSTYLQQILNCDSQFVTPTYLQCCFPESFLSSEKFVRPIMDKFLPAKRPMDNVRIGTDEPQEDENALIRMTTYSPLEKLIFPHAQDYFLHGDHSFLPPKQKQIIWEKALTVFAKKLFIKSGKQILFKNPFHSMRIHTLKKLFPQALFIHIYRNPLNVIPSTVNMWSIVGEDNSLRKEWKKPSYEEVIFSFDTILTKIKKDLSSLHPKHYLEICFESLETKPVEVVESVYSHFNLKFSTTFRSNLTEFLSENASYIKNTHSISPDQIKMIRTRLQSHFDNYKYS